MSESDRNGKVYFHYRELSFHSFYQGKSISPSSLLSRLRLWRLRKSLFFLASTSYERMGRRIWIMRRRLEEKREKISKLSGTLFPFFVPFLHPSTFPCGSVCPLASQVPPSCKFCLLLGRRPDSSLLKTKFCLKIGDWMVWKFSRISPKAQLLIWRWQTGSIANDKFVSV